MPKRVDKRKQVPASQKSHRRILGRVRVNHSRLLPDGPRREEILAFLRSRLTLYAPGSKADKLIRKNIQLYSQVGPATREDDVLAIREAPMDIPPLALKGYQLLERTVRIDKLATGGGTAGGFYAILAASDLTPYSAGGFRVKKVTSWSAPCGNVTESQFAGLQVAGSYATSGTESLPTWVENWTRIGNGFAGVEVEWPMGDFLLFETSSTTTIATHYTALGGAGGVTGIPVVFDVIIECLI